MKKIIMVKKRKSFQNIVVEIYWNANLHGIFFQFKYCFKFLK
jgi:hypothetical protein